MSQDESTPKLHVDSDWKAEAQAEKERLAAAEAKREAEGGPGQGQLPEPDFRTLMGILAQQAIMGLGAVADPKTNRVVVDLEGSKFSIGLLETLEEKTKGNLSDEEAKELNGLIAELRSRFVQIAQLIAQQGAVPSPDAPPPSAGSGLVTP